MELAHFQPEVASFLEVRVTGRYQQVECELVLEEQDQPEVVLEGQVQVQTVEELHRLAVESR